METLKEIEEFWFEEAKQLETRYREALKAFRKVSGLDKHVIRVRDGKEGVLVVERDCEVCPLSWEVRGLEDVDCGCYMAERGEEYPNTLLICMLPRWIKKILLRRVEKRQEKEDLEYLEYLNKCEAERED